jgi:hypothetical protein
MKPPSTKLTTVLSTSSICTIWESSGRPIPARQKVLDVRYLLAHTGQCITHRTVHLSKQLVTVLEVRYLCIETHTGQCNIFE